MKIGTARTKIELNQIEIHVSPNLQMLIVYIQNVLECENVPAQNVDTYDFQHFPTINSMSPLVW